MQELSKEQIDKAAKAARVTAMGQPNWIGTDRHWDDIEEHYKQEWRDAVMAAAPHLQYAPAPIDGDAALKAELAEYKKALGPVTNEELRQFFYKIDGRVCLYTDSSNLNALLARRALLEKKPEPEIPAGLSAESYLAHVGYADSRHSAPAIAKLMQEFSEYRLSEPKP